jgi:hypothetical protein
MVSNTGSDINFVTVTIPPGRTDSLTAGLGAGNSVPVHCVFTVLNGTVADVRASITSSNGASLAAE